MKIVFLHDYVHLSSIIVHIECKLTSTIDTITLNYVNLYINYVYQSSCKKLIMLYAVLSYHN